MRKDSVRGERQSNPLESFGRQTWGVNMECCSSASKAGKYVEVPFNTIIGSQDGLEFADHYSLQWHSHNRKSSLLHSDCINRMFC